MAGTRTTIGGIGGRKFSSKVPGDPTGFGVNTFLLDKLKAAMDGEALAPLVLDAVEPAKEQALAEWPVDTGASRSTIRTEIVETGPHFARAALIVGGIALIEHPDNKSHKDYAPFIEFNGTSKTPPGTLSNAVFDTSDAMKERLADNIRAYLQEIIGG